MISKKSVDEQSKGRIKLVQETWGVFDDVFCAGKDSTFLFLQNVLDEVIALFPSKYVHVGGDECPKTHWKKCPNCQARMKEMGLKDEHELQSYFIQRMEKYLNAKGKTLIGWDEILEGGLAPKAVVMSWRGEQGGIDAAKQNHHVIMTPGNPVYFDYTQSQNEDSVTIGGYNPLEKVYAYEPIPKELNNEQAKYVWGAQANLWTEYVKYPSKVEYMVFPRMSALSEVLWSSKANKNWESFEKRLPAQIERYEKWGAHYSQAYFDLKGTVIPTNDYNGVLWKVETKAKNGEIRYPASELSSLAMPYTEPFLIQKTRSNLVIFFVNNRVKSTLNQQFYFNKATGKKITLTQPPSSKYPGDGAFTLVNGVQNEKGLGKSREFIAYEGGNCEATIDFGQSTNIDTVIIHTIESSGSWIYAPSAIDISKSDDGITFSPFTSAVSISKSADKTKLTLKLASAESARYIRINILNYGTIPEGFPGAGNKAWLFVDEIEVN